MTGNGWDNSSLLSLADLGGKTALLLLTGHVRTYVSDVLSIECGSFVFRSLCLHQDAAPLCAGLEEHNRPPVVVTLTVRRA